MASSRDMIMFKLFMRNLLGDTLADWLQLNIEQPESEPNRLSNLVDVYPDPAIFQLYRELRRQRQLELLGSGSDDHTLNETLNRSFNEQQPSRGTTLEKRDVTSIGQFIGLEISKEGTFGENLTKKSLKEQIEILEYLTKKYTEKDFTSNNDLEKTLEELDHLKIFRLPLHDLVAKVSDKEIQQGDELIPEVQQAIKIQFETITLKIQLDHSKISNVYKQLSALSTHRYAETVQTNKLKQLVKDLPLNQLTILYKDMMAVQAGQGTEEAKNAFAKIRTEKDSFLRFFDPRRGNTHDWENACNAVKNQIKHKAQAEKVELAEEVKTLLDTSVGRLLF